MNDFSVNLPTIKQLQCFIAVAHELNFRRAAEQMKMSQPPLTRQIQTFEALLGQPLFIRNTHQVQLTEAGKQLQRQAKPLIEQLSRLVKELKVESEKLRVGVTRALDFTLIPSIHAHLATLMDIDEVLSYHLNSRQLLKMLDSQNLDIVFTGEKSSGHDDEFNFFWLHREPLMLALPASHPAALQDRVSLKDVADLALFWFSRSANPSFYDKCEQVFNALPFALQFKPESEDSLLTLANVARGNGMALMPQSMCLSTREGLCYRKLDEQTSSHLNIDVYLATRKNERREHVLEAVNVFLPEKKG
ncbi:LysR family transcriptional regulator [Ewingella americana]|uniref:LysR family transcriptional regulator n=2 Tax=Ewingella americana TaxID=41202 RepID=A0A085G3H0_EWIA3|nr:LysR family transcriptional regulator [Ewingella americana]KAA8725678.1 LysR family transcriptional regulator [Ewingella americana]KFC78265.1 LysR family transcriptional regulator [Ewingella americana ATCC 33852]STQ46847.1 Ben and cat operon transcriptional regulator [Ewingella americana]